MPIRLRCERCRKNKKGCYPKERVWNTSVQEKCNICDVKELPCGPPVRADESLYTKCGQQRQNAASGNCMFSQQAGEAPPEQAQSQKTHTASPIATWSQLVEANSVVQGVDAVPPEDVIGNIGYTSSGSRPSDWTETCYAHLRDLKYLTDGQLQTDLLESAAAVKSRASNHLRQKQQRIIDQFEEIFRNQIKQIKVTDPHCMTDRIETFLGKIREVTSDPDELIDVEFMMLQKQIYIAREANEHCRELYLQRRFAEVEEKLGEHGALPEGDFSGFKIRCFPGPKSQHFPSLHEAMLHEPSDDRVWEVINSDEKGDFAKLDVFKRNGIHAAAQSGRVHLLNEAILQDNALLEARDSFGRTPMMTAVMYGHLDSCTRLVKAGCELRHRLGRRNLLSIAARLGRAQILEYFIRDLRFGLYDDNGNISCSPVHDAIKYACETRDVAPCLSLLRLGANFNAVYNERTAVELAKRKSPEHIFPWLVQMMTAHHQHFQQQHQYD